jgi:hypothetical protein
VSDFQKAPPISEAEDVKVCRGGRTGDIQ